MGGTQIKLMDDLFTVTKHISDEINIFNTGGKPRMTILDPSHVAMIDVDVSKIGLGIMEKDFAVSWKLFKTAVDVYKVLGEKFVGINYDEMDNLHVIGHIDSDIKLGTENMLQRQISVPQLTDGTEFTLDNLPLPKLDNEKEKEAWRVYIKSKGKGVFVSVRSRMAGGDVLMPDVKIGHVIKDRGPINTSYPYDYWRQQVEVIAKTYETVADCKSDFPLRLKFKKTYDGGDKISGFYFLAPMID